MKIHVNKFTNSRGVVGGGESMIYNTVKVIKLGGGLMMSRIRVRKIDKIYGL